MFITSFDYQEFNWSLSSIPLGNLNLIVGKNAVGKSKTLNTLVKAARIIKGDFGGVYFDHQCKLVFKLNDNEEMEFSYKIGGNKEIEYECLTKGEDVVLYRKGSEARIKGESVNPPANKLCVQSWRDTERYPEFEAIMKWAEQIKGFSFSDLSSSDPDLLPSMFNETMEFSELYEQIDQEKKDFIIAKMKELDYAVENINPLKISEKYSIITLKEKGVSVPLITSTMSNGMLRVFYIFSYLAYLSTKEGAKTLLIDDLGEGLDYSRSKKLSKIIFDYCEEHGIQLIATSNDNFLMNAVDLRHWIVLLRENENITAVCEKTHPELFLKFKRLGLNNFDLFSTDFISKYMKSYKG